MLLYGPDNAPIRRTIPMSLDTAKALTNGRTFARQGRTILPTLRVEPYCKRCAATGVSGAVSMVPNDSQVEFHCAHAHGRIRTDRPLDVEPLLAALGWGLRCPDCRHDVAGDNPATSARLTVRCACTTRELVLPAA